MASSPFPESAMSLPRHLLGLGGVATAAGLFGLGACSRAAPAAAEARPSRQFEVMHSDAEWRQH
jgi:peptide-methionine (R)-S-oxide reductase